MQAITSPFQVNIANDLMTIRHFHDGHAQMLGLIDLSQPYHFTLDDRRITCLTSLGQLQIQAPAGTDAAALLDCIWSAATRYKHGKREGNAKTRRHARLTRRVVYATGLGCSALMGCAFVVLLIAMFQAKETTDVLGRTYSMPDAQSAAPAPIRPPQVVTFSVTQDAPAGFVQTLQAEMAEESTKAAASPGDGWTLPEPMRAALPINLQMAAERKLFTVEYSSGHARTLYVFADPECPNCQRLEPALEAAAKDFNVVVFPVAVIGREKSIASITPVLCLPPEQRKAAWSDLFDIGHGVMELGKAQESAAVEPGHCDIAGKALGVNEVAYQTYRIPGTPWAIADDGRHVSQEVLQNSLKLQAFMGAAEVPHAAQ